MADWRYDIQYGPDGEANYAFVYDAEGALVSNLRTHHAKAVVDAMNHRAPSADPRPAVQPGAYRWRWAEDEEWRVSANRPTIVPIVEPLYPAPQPLTEGEPSEVGKWAIDSSTDSPILTYEKCSVIQDEQAYYVMSLIRREVGPACRPAPSLPEDVARVVERLCATDTDDGTIYTERRVNPDGPAAAALIQSLFDRLDRAEADCDRLAADNERLREALEGIAAPAIFFLSREDAIKMCNQARAALASLEERT